MSHQSKHGTPPAGSLTRQNYDDAARVAGKRYGATSAEFVFSLDVAGEHGIRVHGRVYMKRDAYGNCFEFFVPDPTPILIGSDAARAPSFEQLNEAASSPP
jgi:hypothetical protein